MNARYVSARVAASCPSNTCEGRRKLARLARADRLANLMSALVLSHAMLLKQLNLDLTYSESAMPPGRPLSWAAYAYAIEMTFRTNL